MPIEEIEHELAEKCTPCQGSGVSPYNSDNWCWICGGSGLARTAIKVESIFYVYDALPRTQPAPYLAQV